MQTSFIFLFLSIALFAQDKSTAELTGTVVISYENIDPNQGMVEASIYNKSETFLVKDRFIQRKRAEVVNGKSQIIFENIPFGKVAVGSYHDVDADGEYDKNWVGLPAEPYAFSKAPCSRLRKPYFEEVSVDFTKSGQVIELTFMRFMD